MKLATPTSPEQLLNWGVPIQEQTATGPKLVSRAQPTELFWSLWKSHKQMLKDWGIAVVPLEHDRWDITWTQPLPEPKVQPPANSAPPTAKAHPPDEPPPWELTVEALKCTQTQLEFTREWNKFIGQEMSRDWRDIQSSKVVEESSSVPWEEVTFKQVPTSDRVVNVVRELATDPIMMARLHIAANEAASPWILMSLCEAEAAIPDFLTEKSKQTLKELEFERLVFLLRRADWNFERCTSFEARECGRVSVNTAVRSLRRLEQVDAKRTYAAWFAWGPRRSNRLSDEPDNFQEKVLTLSSGRAYEIAAAEFRARHPQPAQAVEIS